MGPQDDQAACSLQESCPKVPSCKTGQPYSGRSKHPDACQSLWWQTMGERMPRDETCHASNQEPSKPTTTTTNHTTDQTSANANGLPSILADLTPLLGPMQAEQLAQFLRSISAPQENQEPEKNEAQEKQPEQQPQEQLGQLGQLGGLISTFLGPAAMEAAFPLLEALTKAGHDGQEQPRKGDNQAMAEQVPAQEKEAEEKEKKNVEPEKEKEMETQDDIKEDSDFEVIPEVSQKTSIYPTLPSEEQTRLWKTNLTQPENKDGKETAEKMDSNTHTRADEMKENEKEDKVEAALKTMQAMGFSDDGGWLSSLLRAKSGDVGKVLDAIKPSVL